MDTPPVARSEVKTTVKHTKLTTTGHRYGYVYFL